MSKLERGSIILYKKAILAGKLTLHRFKYTIIYSVFTKHHISDIDPAGNIFVESATIKETFTVSFAVSIIDLYF